MGFYTYKARTITGKISKGTLEAASKEELIRKLKENELYCFEVIDTNEAQVNNKKIKVKELVDFCYKISTMLKSGVAISRALNIIYDSTQNKITKKAAMDLYEGVQLGQSLSDSMKNCSIKFPSLLIYMVEIGESSGTLDNIMDTMSKYYSSEHNINNKIKTAMMYPIILSIVSVLSVTFMLTFVLPQFIGIFKGNELPLPTKILLGLSEFITTKWWFVIIFICLLALGWTYCMNISSFKLKVDEKKLRIPIFGKLIKTVYTYRFASSFSILYRSGVQVLTCLEISARIIGNSYIKEKLVFTMDGLKQGRMLSDELESLNIFDKLLSSMVLIGEETGTLDETLANAGDYFQKEADSAIMKMVALIEPIMIIILAFIIGFIVIAIILPIYSMYTQI